MQAKKIKILHIEDRFHPDMGYQLNNTAKYHGKDIEMHIVCSNSLSLWEGNQKILPKEIEDKDRKFEKQTGIFIHRLPVLYEKKKGYNLLMKGLINKIYKLKPDVLFVHAIESYTAFFLLSKQKIYRDFIVACDTHTLYNQFNNSFFEKIYFYFFQKKVISKLNKYQASVFYTANENKEILIKQYKINSQIVYPYLIGTDSSVFYVQKNEGIDLRKKLGIDKNKKIILYTGKFNQSKNPYLLIEAVQKIKDKLADFIIVMLGGKENDYFNSHFQSIIKNKNFPLIILDAVNVSDLNAYYNMADIAVFPKENTLSALDCQLSGLPIIMEEDTTNCERLKKGGLCYQPGNLTDLANKISKLLVDDVLRNKLSTEGQSFIKKNYAYQEIIQNMEKILQQKLVEKKQKIR